MRWVERLRAAQQTSVFRRAISGMAAEAIRLLRCMPRVDSTLRRVSPWIALEQLTGRNARTASRRQDIGVEKQLDSARVGGEGERAFGRAVASGEARRRQSKRGGDE